MAEGILKGLFGDVMIYILLRLPLKTLLRFKCISKTLYNIIQSSTFINLHLNRTTTTNDEFILFNRSIKEAHNEFKSVMSFYACSHDNYDIHSISPDLDVPNMKPSISSVSHRLIGPCHGLIVLTDTVETILLNPATRNYRILRPSPFDCPMGFCRSIAGVGFGFDSIANDYKIVRVLEDYGDPPFYDFALRKWKIDVYELTIDSWRELDYMDLELPHVHRYPCSEMFYNGTTHWFGRTETVVILCFDMSTETFRNMKMPDACHFKDRKSYGLVVLNDSLTLICYRHPGCVIDPAKDFMEIWTMKEYGAGESWIKNYTIAPLSIKSPLAVWKNHFLLLEYHRSGVLFSYDLNSDEVKELNLHGWPQSLRVSIYKESLTLIPKGSEHSTQVQNF
uniref:S0m-locus linked F-box protein type-7 n=1 Tax=Petunia hybrida TaxID=4102 RepID=A0A140JNS2_PETHY|nr:S0m-locus linked F-box protein type-7 [Petunia x hybrida]